MNNPTFKNDNEVICDFGCLLSGGDTINFAHYTTACWSGSHVSFDSYIICQATYYRLYYTDRLSSLYNANRGHCKTSELIQVIPINPSQPKSTQVNKSRPKSTHNDPKLNRPKSTKVNPSPSKSTQVEPSQPKSTHVNPKRPKIEVNPSQAKSTQSTQSIQDDPSQFKSTQSPK
ncbi:hypothetical protein DPMN_034758 [Dreissena polymorpha]|uniref:Uncharacterized protein n=1 Tax=Dreissena polymorpha TaxID=45954 RepID=A0A9D4M992_DREPO|nr:hypothetical protein DPMN_034758 [Dreissena polymorpha]